MSCVSDSSALRILTVVVNLEKGGTQRVAQTFAEEYSCLGHDSRVLAVRAGGNRLEELRKSGIHVWDGRDAAQVREAAAWAPDVIHLHSLQLCREFVYAVVDACPKAVVVETNVFAVPTPWSGCLGASFQLSDWCRWQYCHRGGDPSRCVVVPNPVAVRSFYPASAGEVREFRDRVGVQAGELLLLRIGQSYVGKWSPLLIEAFDSLGDAGVQARLVLVNPPERLHSYIKDSRFGDRICVIPQILGDASLRVAYSASDLFVHVADQGESFGLVLAESMLCGTPVLTLSTPWEDNSQIDVVSHLDGGIVATSRRGFVSALELLARDAALREELGARGRDRVVRRYAAQDVARLALQHALGARNMEREASAGRPPRSAVLAQYSNAYDPPGWLLRSSVCRLGRLQLSRYLCGYQGWGKLGDRIVRSIGHRLGVCARAERW